MNKIIDTLIMIDKVLYYVNHTCNLCLSSSELQTTKSQGVYSGRASQNN